MSAAHPIEQFTLLRLSLKWLLLALLVALLAGSASALFLHALDWATQTRLAHPWLVWLLPVVGGAVGWVYLKLGKGVEAGNNLLIDEIHDPRKVIPLRMAPLILLSTVASHLVGASVGREGTAVQMGGALADQLTRVFKRDGTDRQLLLMAGISAGFASVFGTPLAGTVFALEVLALGKLRLDALWPCAIAAIAADQVCHAWGAHHAHYLVPLVPSLGAASLGAMLLVGIASGLVALAFARLTHAWSGWMQARLPYAPARPVVGGLVLAAVFWFADAGRYAGLGLDVIAQAFQGPVRPEDFALKTLFTTFSLGSGFKGGEVTPLFYIGATLGNALATVLHQPEPWLAGLGFVAVFAGAANTPLACTLMAVELFGAPMGVSALIACALSYLCSGHNSIYKAQRVGAGKHRHVPQGIRLGEWATRRKPPAPPTH